MASRSRAWSWWLACGWLIACGARTSTDLPPLGSGGGTGGTSSGGSGASGSGGVAGVGASCSAPECQCTDCLSMCVCTGIDPSTCSGYCGGAGGTAGSGGYAGTGGWPTGGVGGIATGGIGGIGTGGTAGSTGSCCVPSPGPGCYPQRVQDCVCQRDSYCCTGAWDGTCVLDVDVFGCGYCNGTGGVGGIGGTGGVSTGGVAGSGGFGAIGGTGGFAGGGTGGALGLCGSPPDVCTKCLCTACNNSLTGCFSGVGCPLILECMGRTACFGYACYQTSTCKDVIDAFGGFLGQPNIDATSLLLCAATSGCQCN